MLISLVNTHRASLPHVCVRDRSYQDQRKDHRYVPNCKSTFSRYGLALMTPSGGRRRCCIQFLDQLRSLLHVLFSGRNSMAYPYRFPARPRRHHGPTLALPQGVSAMVGDQAPRRRGDQEPRLDSKIACGGLPSADGVRRDLRCYPRGRSCYRGCVVARSRSQGQSNSIRHRVSGSRTDDKYDC